MSPSSLEHGGQFRLRPGLRKYACDVTLDLNSAHTQLILSENNKRATFVNDHQPYPDHPERFVHHEQVLSREPLTGRCYWEAEWTGWSYIAVTYKGINRRGGSDSWFGYNDQSWSLYCTENRYSAWHNNEKTDIPAPSPKSKKIGVYVDESSGTLSFYSVCDSHDLKHIHTFKTTFTDCIYAGFRVFKSSLHLCL
ncbi:hypothetical protein DNTS_016408 [Danionella cerebrum]|uniref:B30.2/SPRY domain-containing protein n=1 Tax=Danionella cerebrum TaxID=2873325 RepID=A0A553Q620_9TELE|nr:hypothetical protein DNTS_016408 [Danionella translucida]